MANFDITTFGESVCAAGSLAGIESDAKYIAAATAAADGMDLNQS